MALAVGISDGEFELAILGGSKESGGSEDERYDDNLRCIGWPPVWEWVRHAEYTKSPTLSIGESRGQVRQKITGEQLKRSFGK